MYVAIISVIFWVGWGVVLIFTFLIKKDDKDHKKPKKKYDDNIDSNDDSDDDDTDGEEE